LATINDVAARAGVGAGTVSRVLNDSPRVSARTRARVLAAIEALEYRPSPLARALSRGRAHTLGVVVPFFTHASAVERLRGVVDAWHGSRYDLVLFNVETPLQRDEHFANILRRDRADGLLVVSLPPPPVDLARLVRDGVPVVLVDAKGAGVPCVVTDDAHGGRLATQHLLDLGHERIAFIGDLPDNPFGFTSSAQREQGFKATLRDAGVNVRNGYVRHAPHERDAARACTARLLALKQPPTAIFAASDVQAIGVMEGARDAGLRIPRDLSVVGFDDIEISSYVGLTTVRQPLFQSGRIGGGLLLDAVRGADPPAAEEHELPLELLERSTTAPPPRSRT